MIQKYKKYFIAIAILLLASLGIIYYFIYAPNIAKDQYELLIYPNTGYEKVKEELVKINVISNSSSFDFVAGLMKYKKPSVPSGRYLLRNGMSNRKIIAKLRSGDQDAVNLTFNNVRTLPELAGAISKYIATDSLTMLKDLSDTSFQKSVGLNAQTMMTLFIPNTYDIFWNLSTDKFLKRMKSENDKFWTAARLEKAKVLGLTKEQVYTLASIVEKESTNEKERPTIAGVYLNRLRIGDKLRADPTVVYAVGDFTLRRVLFQHLNYDSPYNTYLYAGLPPGPIAMPSTNSIDAVLNPEKHEYFFFCAKPGYDNEHNFAKTAEQHQKNASIYHAWLTKEGIK